MTGVNDMSGATIEFGIPIHPVCGIVPLMDDQALARLEDDIRENGLRVPLVTHDGMLIDGRNRLIACNRAGVTPRFQPWDGKGSLVKFAWSMNGARRDLTPSQRAAAAVLMLPILEQEAAARMAEAGKHGKEGGRGHKKTPSQKVDSGFSPDRNEGKAAAEAAAITGANRQYVAEAKKLKEEDPEEFEQVKTGKITITQATRKHQEQQREKGTQATRRRKPAPYQPDNPQTRFRKRHISYIEALVALPQPVSVETMAKTCGLSVQNMEKTATLSNWSLVPWFKVSPVSSDKSLYNLRMDRYLHAVCEDPVPRPSLANAKSAAELKTIIISLGDLIREIENRQEDMKINRNPDWNPVIVQKVELVYLIEFILKELKKLAGSY